MSSKRTPAIQSTRPLGFKFPKQTILAIVSEIENGLSRSDACRKYGMSYCTVCDWIKRYGSSQKTGQKTQLSLQKKREIARVIMQGRMTVKEAQTAFKISYPDTIRKWVRDLKKQNNELMLSDPPAANPVTLTQKKPLTEEQLKIVALETMIDMAEQRYKINIRKNSGAKQFPK